MEEEGFFWQEREKFQMNIAKPKAGEILCKLVWEGECCGEQRSSYTTINLMTSAVGHNLSRKVQRAPERPGAQLNTGKANKVLGLRNGSDGKHAVE